MPGGFYFDFHGLGMAAGSFVGEDHTALGAVGSDRRTGSWGEGLCLYLHLVRSCDFRVHRLVHRRDLHHVLVLEKTVVVAACWGFGSLGILGLLEMLGIEARGLAGRRGHCDMLAGYQRAVALGSHAWWPIGR